MNELSEEQIAQSVAIIGMAGRFPGAESVKDLWKNLISGVDSVELLSDEELRKSGAPDEMLNSPYCIKRAGVLHNIDMFDAKFFGYSPREAEIIDPQQRLLLECAWEAFEDAGYTPESIEGSVGVFAGAGMNYYFIKNLLSQNKRFEDIVDSMTFIGNDKDYLCSRIAYKLGLKGPCYVVNSACSTSLVAVQVGYSSLLTGQCDVTLCGGVALQSPRSRAYLYTEGDVFSKDGTCRTFDKDASGMVFGEGLGLVLLKRLEDAINDNDHVYAIIRSAVVNNDGSAKAGYTAPGIDGQFELISLAQDIADVNPEEIAFIEAHGTGTKLGDAIEVSALTQAFRRKTDKKQFCAIGSIKTNVGHLDVAAGISALIKASLAVKERVLPPSLHCKEVNPELRLEESPFYVAKEPVQWKNSNKNLVAGVSSFGMGGTNAHVVIQEPFVRTPSVNSRKYHLVPLSACSEKSLQNAITRLGSLSDESDKKLIQDIAYTLQVGRRAFKHRWYAVCQNTDELISLSKSTGSAIGGNQVENIGQSIVFAFSGQGSQYIRMGKELYENESSVRSIFDEAREIIKGELGEDFFDVLFPSYSIDPEISAKKLTETYYAQSALYILEYAVAKCAISYGINPSACIGHSIGEYVAASLAGVFTFDQGLKIVLRRSKAMDSAKPGVMAYVALAEQELKKELFGELVIALVNGPALCVVSGSVDEVNKLVKNLNNKQIRNGIIHTSHAFHSPMMSDAADLFKTEIQKFKLNKPSFKFISNVTGTWITDEQCTSPDYWARHIRETVRFSDGVETLLTSGYRTFLEIGPGNGLSTMIKMHVEKYSGIKTIPTVRHIKNSVDDEAFFLGAIGELWASGVEIDWNKLYSDGLPHRIPLPTYSFERKRFWIDPMLKNEPKYEDSDISRESDTSESVVDKENTLEAVITKIWKDTLGVGSVNLDDDFYELGGNSLMASQLMSRIYPLTGGLINIGDLLKNTTLRSQIELVGKNCHTTEKKELSTIQLISRGEGVLPLSSAQERLWFIYKMDPNNISFNLAQGISIKGSVNTDLLKKAWNVILSRHEILRSVFIETETGPVVRIMENVESTCIEEDLSSNSNSIFLAHEKIIESTRKVFDLEKGPLFKVVIYRISHEECYFILYIHHIISDGWSMSIWIDELTTIYDALSKGQEPELSSLPLQFIDYAGWSQLEEKKFSDDRYKKFWLETIGSKPTVLQLPTDNRRPEMPNYYGNIVSFSLTTEQYEKITKISTQNKVTKFNILLGMFFTLLYRYSNQEQIFIGCPNANRSVSSDIEKLIGFFINMVPYKADFTETTTFKDLLQQLKKYYEESVSYQDIPFAKLVELINPPRVTNSTPIFQVMFAFQNYPYKIKPLNGITIDRMFIDRGASEYDISLYLVEENKQISGIFEYSTELFNESTMVAMTEVFKHLIQLIIDDLDKPLIQIPLMPNNLKQNFTTEKQKTLVHNNSDKTVVQLFEHQVIQSKNSIACVLGADSVTYKELNERANQLSSYFQKLGIVSNDLVGIMVKRSIEMVVVQLAVLKVGGGYVPLDPSFPKERLSYMIKDSKLKILITNSDLDNEIIIPENVNVISLDGKLVDIEKEPNNNLALQIDKNNIAYVIYTSGSTGNPKGVAVPHKALSNFLLSMIRKPGLRADDTLLAITTISFDISGLEIFGPLVCGARIIIADSISASNGEKLLSLLKKHKVTVMQATPATWKLLLEAGWTNTPGLRVLCGGEALTRDLAQKMLATKSEVWNMFGPTETTIWSSAGRVFESDDDPDIGEPIDNTWFIIVDKSNNPLPDGLYGELAIGGDGLARGYLYREELTSERFINIDGIGRVYKTGDLVRKRSDGTYEYNGRIDFQVKINGFRIELGEIESVLKKVSQIKDAVVNVVEDKEKNRTLVAYIVVENGLTIESDIVRDFCKEKLPYYMVPQIFVTLEQFPLTANGKIDRKNLPLPQSTISNKSGKYEAPTTAVEKKLVNIWKQLLSIDPISITDNYFEIGGTSLLATRLFSRIEKELGVSLPIATLFAAPTIKLLAKSVDRTVPTGNEWALAVPIKLAKQKSDKKPLFLIHGGGGNILLYRELANCLPEDQTVYGIQAQGLDGKHEVLTTIEDMAARYIKEIFSIQPNGPYYLGGYCMGGTLAYETARQLRSQGREVRLVALLDTYREWYELSKVQRMAYLLNNIQFHLKNVSQASLKGKYLFLKERSTEAIRRIDRKAKVLLSNVGYKLKLRNERPLIIMENVNDLAALRYKAKPYDGVITVFKPKSISDVVDPFLGWKNVETGGVDLVNLSAYRNGILVSPFVSELAEKLAQKLDQARMENYQPEVLNS